MASCNSQSNINKLKAFEDHLTKEELQHYRQLFASLDDDESGLVDIEKVALVVSKFGKTYNAYDIQKILHKLANWELPSDNYFVNFPEFLAVIATISATFIPEEEMLKIFEIFDQDGDGFICSEELKKLLSKLGEDVSEEELQEMIQEADKDGDGMVSYIDFVKLMTNSDHEISDSSHSTNSEIADIHLDENSNSSSLFESQNSSIFYISESENDIPTNLKENEYNNEKQIKETSSTKVKFAKLGRSSIFSRSVDSCKSKYKRRASLWSTGNGKSMKSSLSPNLLPRNSCPNINTNTTKFLKPNKSSISSRVSAKFNLMIKSKRNSY